jgi:FAD-linked oxidoreductase
LSRFSRRGYAKQPWQNWSGSVQTRPRQIVRPVTIDELAKLLGSYGAEGRHVRVVGAGHSFTPLVQSNDILMSLDKIQGIEAIDREEMTVTVSGGTRLKKLGEQLHGLGLAQENLGDIDLQSIAGAISTGTHGTGTRFGTISTQVVGLTLVTATGEVLECSPERNPDLFQAAQVSLGTLGVIAKVKLRVVPARRMQLRSQRAQLSDCLSNLERYKQENSHFTFFWLPYTETVRTKFMNETEAQATGSTLWRTFNEIVVDNGVTWLLSECCRRVPAWSAAISNISAQAISSVQKVDYSHRLFAMTLLVRVQAMEYLIPADYFTTVIAEIQECIKRERFAVHVPIECRFVHADDIWLSPAYQRESASVAVHMYKGMAYQEYFGHMEEIFRRYQGRPHWGKMHTQDAASLAELYPRWYDFQRVRDRLDPQGMFLNEYVRTLFGADGTLPTENK